MSTVRDSILLHVYSLGGHPYPSNKIPSLYLQWHSSLEWLTHKYTNLLVWGEYWCGLIVEFFQVLSIGCHNQLLHWGFLLCHTLLIDLHSCTAVKGGVWRGWKICQEGQKVSCTLVYSEMDLMKLILKAQYLILCPNPPPSIEVSVYKLVFNSFFYVFKESKAVSPCILSKNE